MSPKNFYHLTPRLDIPPPPNGPINLGQLFATPHDLRRPLEKVTTYQKPVDADVFTETKNDYRLIVSKEKNGKVGLWAKLLDFKALGGDLGGGFDASREGDYAFDALTTTFIQTDEEYIAAAINREAPKLFLKNKKVVYMLQALMTAEGTTFHGKHTKGGEGHIQVGSSGNGPVAAGADVHGGYRNTASESFEESSGFVFAYSMLKIQCRLKKDSDTYVPKKTSPVAGGFLDAEHDMTVVDTPLYEIESVEQEEDGPGNSVPTPFMGPPIPNVVWEGGDEFLGKINEDFGVPNFK